MILEFHDFVLEKITDIRNPQYEFSRVWYISRKFHERKFPLGIPENCPKSKHRNNFLSFNKKNWYKITSILNFSTYTKVHRHKIFKKQIF